jgi:hypothetical protein
MSDTSREQFAQKVIDIVRAKFPLVKIARSEQAFSLKVNGHVASLENLYRIARLRPDDVGHNVERWAVELLRAGEGTPDHGATFEQLQERVLPMVLSQKSSDPEASVMITQPLVPGLQIAYAIDSDRTISYIPQPLFKRWGLSVDELHETAMSNLISRSEAINAQAATDDNGIYLILFQTLDGFDASRLLLPTLHDRLREHLGSPFAAAIPHRDILLCFRNDDATVEGLRDQIKTEYRKMPHQVTDKLILVTADGLAPRD